MTTEFINRVTEKFNQNNVEYLVTGGCAKLIRNEKKSTLDLDLLVKVDKQNIYLIQNSLIDLGIKQNRILDDLKKGKIIRIKLFPFNIDLMPRLDGLNTEETFTNSEQVLYHENLIPLISKEDLIINYKSF